MIVETEGLTKRYGSQVVLTGLDLKVAEGSVLALLGPNGAGKTTTIRILSTLTRPDGGTARVCGFDVVREAGAVRGAISLTGQYAAVDEEQTGRENLVMIARLRGLTRPASRSRATALLERFDLADAAGRRVRTYSGGMRRRLDLAMSLVTPPRLLFLDEPTTGLDPVSRTTMWDAIGDLVRDGVTIFLTTQYLEEADRLADRILVLHNGGVVADGTADALKNSVGGTRLDLTFASVEDARRAEAAVGGVADGPVLSLPSDGSAAHLHRVLDDLRGARAGVLRVSTHRPTLDDVFTSLTAVAA
ncbi:ATP-binding cassette domain-containing protein [Lentzea cavernae]|uniref:Daunorubicin resistance protein DrrA family ABC transporter ATP-binding protein n=1 Tax=Lentzea cavernae TaxID=2020703 RepID=A0ABQ3MRL4_9PSEU|nr:ATP-binding cassette domain-containing protein [Lentzea cavernae]GHH59286.1 daunorubicin resistance protein DrrA family ABC transporter ATP-binding protein [Lentzea cavernae]